MNLRYLVHLTHLVREFGYTYYNCIYCGNLCALRIGQRGNPTAVVFLVVICNRARAKRARPRGRKGPAVFHRVVDDTDSLHSTLLCRVRCTPILWVRADCIPQGGSAKANQWHNDSLSVAKTLREEDVLHLRWVRGVQPVDKPGKLRPIFPIGGLSKIM